MKGKSIKIPIVFAGVFILMNISFVSALKFSEPYPAIIFPGFGGVPPKPVYIESTKYDIFVMFEDGKKVQFNSKDLFKGYQYFSYAFVPHKFTSEGLKKSLQERKKDFSVASYNFTVHFPPRNKAELFEELKIRFKEEIIKKYPRTTPTTVTFVWSQIKTHNITKSTEVKVIDTCKFNL